MFQVKPESPYPALAEAWSRPDGPDAAAVDSTREALSTVRPDDLGAVAPLADVLLRRVTELAWRDRARRALFALLDGVRRRAFTLALQKAEVDPWLGLVLRIVREADYAFSDLLRSREETDPKTVALRVLGQEACELTVADLSRRTRAIARGLLGLVDGTADAKVAILSENCLEGALCDLACLSNGIVDLPLPANAVAEQVVFMLKHSGAQVLLVSDEEQLAKVLPSLPALPELEQVVVFSRAAAERNGLLSLDQMVSQGAEFDDGARAARAAAVKATDVATVMYTSGTTGKPKGIVFTHENLVSKRFARAFALPLLSEGDVFLAYLPLYHTFGRWLELVRLAVLGRDLRLRPLHRAVHAPRGLQAGEADGLHLRPEEVDGAPRGGGLGGEPPRRIPTRSTAHLRAITGGRLRYGLSAAGYLDPTVFRAFHARGHRALLRLRHDRGDRRGHHDAARRVRRRLDRHAAPRRRVPPRRRRRAPHPRPLRLPGLLQARAARTRGHDPTAGSTPATSSRSIPTATSGSPAARRRSTRTAQGQTIAPQRVENLFRDFEAISQAFLVGDHREYNTLLVWPNPASPADRGAPPRARCASCISSLVASANRFLAPYERVVGVPDAAARPRPRARRAHPQAHLQARAWWRRAGRTLIERMYEQKHLALPGRRRVPAHPELGAPRDRRAPARGRAPRRRAPRRRAVRQRRARAPRRPGALRVGDLAYTAEGTVFDLGALLSRPSLWLGNDALRRFLGDEAFASLTSRRRKGGGDIKVDARLWPAPAPDAAPGLLAGGRGRAVRFHSIHAAGELLRAERPEARLALEHLHAGRRGRAAGRGPDAAARCSGGPPTRPTRTSGAAPSASCSPTRSRPRPSRPCGVFLDRLGPFALRDEDLAIARRSAGLTDAQVAMLLGFLVLRRGARVRHATPRTGGCSSARCGCVAATAIAHPL